jgi:hypothetical protein
MTEHIEHHEKNDSLLKIAFNLAGACIISGIIIATVYFLTDDIAKQKQAELNTLALKSLVTEADQYTPIEGKSGWYQATQNGQLSPTSFLPKARGMAAPSNCWWR